MIHGAQNCEGGAAEPLSRRKRLGAVLPGAPSVTPPADLATLGCVNGSSGRTTAEHLRRLINALRFHATDLKTLSTHFYIDLP